MRNVIKCGASVTGQTPLFSPQMQDWARQTMWDKDIECYCLDAPLYIPSGVIKARVTGQYLLASDLFTTRDGTY